MIALEAAFSGGPGVVCISGTGSVAFGRNERGELARAGGWGRLVSDEGSGHWIGQRAVSQSLRAMDMGRSSSYGHRNHGAMEHRNPRATCAALPSASSIPDFADLFPIVLAAAEAGDPLASEILTAAGIELARIAQIVLRRLWVGHTSHGNRNHRRRLCQLPRVRQVFGNVIRSRTPRGLIRLSNRQPIEGALYLAQQALPESAVG